MPTSTTTTTAPPPSPTHSASGPTKDIFGPGPRILPLTLTVFVQRNISFLFGSSTDEFFEHAFDAFISRHANITVNGLHLSRAEFMAQILADRFAREEASVKFLGAVEVPDATVPCVENAGVVGVFYEATIYEKFKVMGGPATRILIGCVNAIVEQERDASGDLVPRHVVLLNQVVAAKGETILP
ncbi:hypothetical protein BD410DRAFT_795472 [Rickenella mellea]|uniref:Uncharacterized protein n=1 Tax=Rickenella mellea TaxID=50990 RepID=A0A4Y7PMY3_9AGAM|nr:hypothetical protein BD410DRAFT_795472 [Rickenella mellea]